MAVLPGNPPAGERADQIAAAADRFCRLGRLVPGIEQHTLPAGEDLRECQRAFPPRLSCGRDDAAVDSGDDTRRGSHARAGRCRHLPHRFPIVSGPLREVEKLLDEGRSGAGRCCRRCGSARTEQRRVDRVGDDTRQGASSRPLEDGAEALLFEWSLGCVDERVQQDDAQAQERERQTALPRGFDPLPHVGADLFDLSERRGACRPARDGCARAGTDRRPVRREPGHRVPPAATRRDRDPRAGCAIGAPALRT